MIDVFLPTVLDATGKPPIGLTQGNLNWVGQLDQCKLITVNRTNFMTGQLLQENAFHGSYCDMDLSVPESLNIPAAVSVLAFSLSHPLSLPLSPSLPPSLSLTSHRFCHSNPCLLELVLCPA